MKPHVHIPYRSLEKYINILRENHLNLEVYIDSDTIDDVPFSEIVSLKERIGYSPEITIHGPFMDLSPGAPDRKIRHVTYMRFEYILDIASAIKAKGVVFHSGYEKWRYGHRVDVWLENSLKTWFPLKEKAGSSGIVISIENIFEDEPTNLRLLMEEAGGRYFGLCFDTGHFNLFSKVSLEDWLSETKPYIKEIHLHNNDRSMDQHYPIDEGTFDHRRFFELFRDNNCIYTVEAHRPEHVMRSLRYLENLKEDATHSSI